jgi:hypothetical protein
VGTNEFGFVIQLYLRFLDDLSKQFGSAVESFVCPCVSQLFTKLHDYDFEFDVEAANLVRHLHRLIESETLGHEIEYCCQNLERKSTVVMICLGWVVNQLSDDAVLLLINRAKKTVSNDLEKLVKYFLKYILKMKLQKSPEMAVQINL